MKLFATASFSARRSIAGVIAASVVMNPSIVAMFGSIIPEPLTHPPTVILLPPIATVAAASFGLVSVVITAFATASDFSRERPSAFAAAFAPAASLSTGSRRPITPVDATSTSNGSIPSSPAVTSAENSASFSPTSPVHAFAHPEFASIACMRLDLTTLRS